MANTKKRFALALHGGAGAVAGRDYAVTEKHLGELARECESWLTDGRSALDVVEHAVYELETCGLYVAGRGSAPNSAGHVELDASIMDGRSRQAGAVAALRDFVSPVQVARGVMEKTPHVMLAGSGALEFARANGFSEVADPATYYSLPVGVTSDDIQDISHGTVGAVALDRSGGLAAATSTGGTFGKLHGRIGDTPLIGPGTWADDDIAISFTGTGEHIIRAGGATAIAFRYRSGVPLPEAIEETLGEIKRLGGDAGVIAVTSKGEIAMPYNSEGMKRASVSTDSTLTVATFS
ncbi:MAG: isoaspartyl peptidase/L-asparaginase [Gammaproteobacteria bacterium]|nr:isoaspartyl peptidase/L-asparaginase [Gammaproteobacteria bacterium]MBT8110050.1 isoaspartyl peptidase/L-asparaginase [Gammaproteobacteria bacterium]NND47873.1 isoaspartyl peptidase/L-asparaginase [Woeseiaceae bacterium]NNL44754.1 isoaspartyl peptidase/L-asparaginase [Woeseiaceae bacterium]